MSKQSFYRILFKTGLSGFGGGLALIGLLHRKLVKKEKLVPEKDFADGVTLSQLLPGPIITDLVAFLGTLLGGIRTAFLGMLVFILPSFLIMLGMSAVYFNFQKFSVFPEILSAFRPVVVGLVGATLWQLARKNLRGRKKWLIFIICLGLFVSVRADFFVLIVVSGILGYLWKTEPE